MSDEQPGNASWDASVQNAELRDLVQKKGWDSPEKALESYRNLEKHIGVPADRLLKLPEKSDDPEWGGIRKKLGFAPPDDAAEYELPIPDGFTDDYAKFAREAFKEIGIPKDMAKALAEKNNGWIQQQFEAAERATEARVTEAQGILRGEWGGKYEETMALAQRAEEGIKRDLGLGEETLKAWQDADPAAYYKLLAFQASKIAEAPRIDGEGGSQGGQQGMSMSPEAAKTRLSSLMGDKAWFARWESGDSAAIAEFKGLNAVIRDSRQK